MNMYYIYFFCFYQVFDVFISLKIKYCCKWKFHFLKAGHLFYLRVISAIQNNFVSMPLQHLFFISDNHIFSARNLIIVMYYEYCLLFILHSHFPLIIAFQINLVFVTKYRLNNLLGSCINRYNHSKLLFCIHIGARLIFSA